MTKTEVRENWDAKLIAHLALGGVAGLPNTFTGSVNPVPVT
jgi:hypothetical protein